ncbi:MAG: hypothetical protein FWF44_00920 [Defluviitaleaceae bacterium]|nr:hypothetical protein [Defluviitaleaceae bacterium]
MKWKSLLTGALVLAVPVVVLLALTPLMPEAVTIPVHMGFGGVSTLTMDRKFVFLLGIIPFIIYVLYKIRRDSR